MHRAAHFLIAKLDLNIQCRNITKSYMNSKKMKIIAYKICIIKNVRMESDKR